MTIPTKKSENRSGVAAPEADFKRHSQTLANKRMPAAASRVNRDASSAHAFSRRQTVFRAAGERHFTPIRNDFLQHPDIPYDVKGLVSEILSRPPGWKVSVKGILVTNSTVGERKLHRMLRDAEPFRVIQSHRDRDARGVLASLVYYVSDDPAEVDRAIQKHIEDAAEELADMISNGEPLPHFRPHRQNSSVAEPEPHRSCPRVGPPRGDFVPPTKERLKKGKTEKTKDSLLRDAKSEEGVSRIEFSGTGKSRSCPTADALPDDQTRTLFDAIRDEVRWHQNSNHGKAWKVFQRLAPEDQQLATKAAPLLARDMEGLARQKGVSLADQRGWTKKLETWLEDGLFRNYRAEIADAERAPSAADISAALHAEAQRAEIERQEAISYIQRLLSGPGGFQRTATTLAKMLSNVRHEGKPWNRSWGDHPDSPHSVLRAEFPDLLEIAGWHPGGVRL